MNGSPKSLLVAISSSPLQCGRLGVCHLRCWLKISPLCSANRCRGSQPAFASAGSRCLGKTIYAHHSLRSAVPFLVMEAEEGSEKESDSHQQGKVEEAGKSAQQAVELGDPPEKPLAGDCCGQGCVRCVWDVYSEELADYKKRKEVLDKA